MSDLIQLREMLIVACADDPATPPLPCAAERRAIRRAAGVDMIDLAAAVGVSRPTIYRAETGTGMTRSVVANRRYRRVLNEMRSRVLARDPRALSLAAQDAVTPRADTGT
jgi:predicted transcriptional regulator